MYQELFRGCLLHLNVGCLTARLKLDHADAQIYFESLLLIPGDGINLPLYLGCDPLFINLTAVRVC